MLRESTRLVTDDAPEKLGASGFVAFAIDWELEGDEMAKSLKQRGPAPAKMRAWKKQGWI